ncbi:unnamed protein product [Oppiella nova]|uniref:Uncharacterized protein n=1 Tax=Oppiella nova TaxID=334625 RepID=A0A7R9LPM0_9ACAR|nr:unnamed protein product [Oppiella nova]CAG2165727.1 unnamed protein product [Oppiella nova]
MDDNHNFFNVSFEHSYGDHLGRPLRKLFSSSGQFSELYLCLTVFTIFLVVTCIFYITRKSCGIALDMEGGKHTNRLDLVVPPITLS